MTDQDVAGLRECNLVLEGGITSGIVYPALIVELARTYRFRCLGGSSAGAIGAAFAAAAEYGRQCGQGGMDALEREAAWLGQGAVPGPLHLQQLFQPQTRTRGTFNFLSGAVGKDWGWRGPLSAMRVQPLAAIVGALPGLGSALVARTNKTSHGRLAGTLIGLGLGAAGAATAALGVSLASIKSVLEGNHYGLCDGSGSEGGGVPALTDWFTDALDRVAGRGTGGDPLTFEDLTAQGIDLQMMTTCLSHGRPYRLPFTRGDRFYFRESEFRALFPERVVKYLLEHPRPISSNDERAVARRARLAAQGLHPLPAGPALPVALAARLSLSFPGLISAVPLYTVDYSLAVPESERTAECAYFSDGGLASNFPVHLFDDPLPKRPTFAVNLRRYPRGQEPSADEAENVWMPDGNRGGLNPTFSPIEGLGGFGLALLDTAKNWGDGVFVQAPGYRDRIVHVHLAEDEGGLNLGMDAETVTRLMERGRAAAHLITTRFASGTAWDNHRRVRLLSLLAGVEALAREFEAEVGLVREGEMPWPEILAARNRGYPLLAAGQQVADQVAQALQDLGKELKVSPVSLRERGAPRPQLELKLRPEP
ncbi:SuhR protein (plasmid) [Deinococcus metallilatus]|uniref:Acylesterase/phospholipase RssA n=1 Tax=Deinococcus metallilatus TaxID=1211322 RepID=A0AAJ5F507_9DEIO|nr:patatin-like phospholipase family protein [Deinococcus metallilatus]MBB5293759.1 putative acylesterase/phospholipase RssA [Deinococcus metallilatus]QBY07279.1 SuhR protein [Deinococcus metallilatus]RXJ14751.1 SuhR protein [Deinococcus metallilatus]TLK30871.1 SuhR protein [Deinococcus metallilatus]GMA17688.1 RpoH suppressor [Deinococcus metallilatus]